jgi:predicted nuclease of predicted toxin-antitoxin system
MKIWSAQEGLATAPVVQDNVRTLLVRDAHGNPIILAVQQGPDNVLVVTPQDSNFNDVIEQLGINKRIVITKGAL